MNFPGGNSHLRPISYYVQTNAMNPTTRSFDNGPNATHTT